MIKFSVSRFLKGIERSLGKYFLNEKIIGLVRPSMVLMIPFG